MPTTNIIRPLDMQQFETMCA